MYGTGIPVGLLIDSKGPRPGVLIGVLAIGSGYFLIYKGLWSTAFSSRSPDERFSLQQRSRFYGCSAHLFLLVLDGNGQLLCVLCSNQDVYVYHIPFTLR